MIAAPEMDRVSNSKWMSKKILQEQTEGTEVRVDPRGASAVDLVRV
jgi:hypothetical protein